MADAPVTFAYAELESVEVQEGVMWTPVTIAQCTWIRTADGQRHPVYKVEESDGTRWLVGEGEMRKIQA